MSTSSTGVFHGILGLNGPCISAWDIAAAVPDIVLLGCAIVGLDRSVLVVELPPQSTCPSRARILFSSCTANRVRLVPLRSLFFFSSPPKVSLASLENFFRPFICSQTKHRDPQLWLQLDLTKPANFGHTLISLTAGHGTYAIALLYTLLFDLPRFVSSALCDVYLVGLSLACFPNLQTPAVSHPGS